MSLLVNYDSSDSEGNCDETVHLGNHVEIGSTSRFSEAVLGDKNVLHGSGLSSVQELPTPTEISVQDMIVLPSSKEVMLREKPPILVKNNKICIPLPSIESSDSEEDVDPPSKKLCLQSKLSMLVNLPKPKFVSTKDVNRPLVPHQLMKKTSLPAPSQPANAANVDDDVDDSDEDNIQDDVGRGMNFLMPTEVGTSSFHESEVYRYKEFEGDSSPVISPNAEVPQPVMPQDFGRDEEFQKIIMSQNILEVNLDEHLGQFEAERLKDITRGPALGHNQKPTGNINPQSRRKHQITYLALQAKEREFELKNQWAENKFNKRQTQSKYGF